MKGYNQYIIIKFYRGICDGDGKINVASAENMKNQLFDRPLFK